MNIETSFQKGLIAFMKRKNYTQTSLAEALGITKMTVSYWVNGKHEPVLKDIKKLIAAGMTKKEIFGD